MVEVVNTKMDRLLGLILAPISYINIMECLGRVKYLIEKHKLKNIHFLHFDTLEISEQSLISRFVNNPIKLFIYAGGFKINYTQPKVKVRNINENTADIEGKINLVLDFRKNGLSISV